jgi:hypothetical protein
MLVIRQEQIDTLIKGTDEEFVEFLVGHVKEEFPEKTAARDDETLREMVRGGIRRAESHGFKTAEDTTAFISIMFEIAPNFDDQPPIREVLDEEAWAEAEKNYNEKAWFPERENA